jgi:hypothetical protein
LLGKYYPDEIGIGREKLVRALAARDVPYWPADPDLAALWRKLSGQDDTQQIQHVRSEVDWIEFYLNGVRRVVGPIYVGREAVVALLPVEARTPSSPAPTPTSDEKPNPPRGPQSTRAIRALRKLYPPHGRVPAGMDIEAVRGMINGELGPETRQLGKAEISWDVTNRVVTWLGRADGP